MQLLHDDDDATLLLLHSSPSIESLLHSDSTIISIDTALVSKIVWGGRADHTCISYGVQTQQALQ